MATNELRQAHQQLLDEATRLAGSLTALSQRATTYHHLFRDSGGNHVFPLIAAHGALWARGYFMFGMKLGRWLSWQYLFDADHRQRQLCALEDFANAFRDVNRRVCIDTYANYHFAARFGEHPEAESILDPQLLDALNRVHAARRAGRELSDGEKRHVFETHFLHEQTHVVGPSLQAAVEKLDWPLLRAIALRPLIRFAYFRDREFFWFRNFARREERIEKGLRAFEIATSLGWNRVESALQDYDILPSAFFADSVRYFAELRAGLLTT
ncbi:MAG: hypothetical protein IAG10_17835 [Planctomycetaceae bacterium]|nr:hypothetical protein [Planctomycetaceae bacterium]